MIRSILTLSLLLCFYSCNEEKMHSSQDSQTESKQFITQDVEWTNTFNRDEGVFGVDGIFAIPLNGREFEPPSSDKDSTLFVFSDSLIKLKGKIKNNSLEEKDYKMTHNSLGMAVGTDPKSTLEFYYKTEDGQPKTIFEPAKTAETKDHYYWLGDGFVNTAADSSLYIFAYDIVDIETDGFFSFAQLGVSILKIDKEEKYPYKNYEIIKTGLLFPIEGKVGETTFGSAVLVNTKEAGAPFPDGYIYVYGAIGYEKDLLVTRVLPEDFDDMDAWTFWDGKAWSKDKKDVVGLTKGVSNEMSVSPLPNGQYILIYQNGGVEPKVMMQLAKSPFGPFYPPKILYHCLEEKEDKDFFTYNAKGHPSISPPDSLVISYNVNSFDFFTDVLTKSNLYRPRFIKISLE